MDEIGVKAKILAGILERGKNVSFEKMTVSSICESAGVTRQAFYRHFKDKYDVSSWFTHRLIDKTCRQIGFTVGWHEGYRAFFRLAERNISLLQTFHRSRDRNSIYEDTIRSSCQDYLEGYRVRQGKEPDDLIVFQARRFAVTATSTTEEWIMDGCPVPADDFVDMYLTLIPHELFKALDMPENGSIPDDAMLLMMP